MHPGIEPLSKSDVQWKRTTTKGCYPARMRTMEEEFSEESLFMRFTRGVPYEVINEKRSEAANRAPLRF